MFIWLYVIGFGYIILGWQIPNIKWIQNYGTDARTLKFYRLILIISGGISLLTAMIKTVF